MVLSFALLGCCQHLAGTLFESIDEVENITTQYFEALKTQFEEQSLFPSIRFTTDGTIIGWRFASVAGQGKGTTRISVWSPNPPGSDNYVMQDSLLMQQCVASEVTLGAGETVRFHNGGPLPGVEGLRFSEGDIIGLLLRAESVAAFAPYLYNTSVVNPFQGQEYQPLSFFQTTRREQSPVSLQSLQSAPLLPLLALDLCKLT